MLLLENSRSSKVEGLSLMRSKKILFLWLTISKCQSCLFFTTIAKLPEFLTVQKLMDNMGLLLWIITISKKERMHWFTRIFWKLSNTSNKSEFKLRDKKDWFWNIWFHANYFWVNFSREIPTTLNNISQNMSQLWQHCSRQNFKTTMMLFLNTKKYGSKEVSIC